MSCWEGGAGSDCGPVGTAAGTGSLSGAVGLLMNEDSFIDSFEVV